MVVQEREVRAGSDGSYRLSRWLYECVCKPSFETQQVKDHRPGDSLRTLKNQGEFSVFILTPTRVGIVLNKKTHQY